MGPHGINRTFPPHQHGAGSVGIRDQAFCPIGKARVLAQMKRRNRRQGFGFVVTNVDAFKGGATRRAVATSNRDVV